MRVSRSLAALDVIAIATSLAAPGPVGAVSPLSAAALGDPAPAAPAGPAATPGDGSVSLAWNPNSEPTLAGYNVYRSDVLGGPSVTAIAAGDIASCASTGDEATAALLDTLSGDVITLGDNVYDSGTATEFSTCFDPTWGRAKTRIRPALGNHEYTTPGASGYFGYFGAAAGDLTKGYYSCDYGAWHVVVLNTGDCAIVVCAAGSPEEQWLRADLAASQASCTLAIWHQPRFSSGTTHGNTIAVQPLYQALWLRAQISGSGPTTIRVRGWADGTIEPATWQYTATSAAAGLQVAGGVGIRAFTGSPVTNGPITLSFDDFAATGIAGP